MNDYVILYGGANIPLTEDIKKHYPGLNSSHSSLLLEFYTDGRILNIYGLSSYQYDLENNQYSKSLLNRSLINPLELQYLSEKFRGKKDYEDYSKPTIEYLKSTGRLTDNDYIYFMNRLKWTYDVVKVEDSYGFFDQNCTPVEWGALPGQDSLVFVGRESEIIEIYSGFNREDEYRYETIVDRKQLDISKIDEKYMAEFRRFVFG